MINLFSNRLLTFGLSCALICIILSSCNASIESVSKKPIKIKEEYRSTINYNLVPLIDIESMSQLKQNGLGDYHQNLILLYTLKL